MKETRVETVGKVFVVVGRRRKCLVRDGMFTRTQAANHTVTTCLLPYNDDAYNERAFAG